MTEYIKVGERDGEIVLQAPDGARASFEFLELANVNGREYAALLERGDDAATILRFLEDGERERYALIEDDAEFEAAAAALELAFGGD